MKQLILSAVFLVLGVGLFFGITTSVLDQVNTKRAERDALADILNRFNDIRKIKNDLINSYNSISEEDLSKLNEVVPPNAKEGDLLVTFENMAKDSGLLLKNIEIKSAVPKDTGLLVVSEDPYDKVSITLTLDGSYEALRSFLSNLERSMRILDVKALSFHAASSATSYEYSMEVTAYMKKQPK